jgi:ribonucleoside-diphosphate reductase alpha subunit
MYKEMTKPNAMKVVKRDGRSEEVSFDKITRRIRNECEDLEIEPILVAQKICSQIYNNIKTSELDDYTARIAAAMYTNHPDFGKLASRIFISNYHKIHKRMGLFKFSDKVEKLYHYVNKKNHKMKLLSDEFYQIVQENKNFLDNLVDYKKDYKFDYFGYKTLEKSYFLRCDDTCIETPQDLLMRVSIGLHGNDMIMVKNSYTYMSEKYFTHASPTMFNAGTPYPQLLSCFLFGVDDTLESIYQSYYDCAMISKRAGGIGGHLSDLRSKGSIIKGTNGESSGLVPVCKQYNQTALHVNQGGRRNGSIAVYLEPHHPDVLSFLKLKLPSGSEEERARDLFYAMWISDLFMERVEKDEMWSLFSPDEVPEKLTEVWGEEYRSLYEKYEREKLYREQVPARLIFRAICKSQIETGTPYMCYKDSVNRKSNQQHYGTIKSSNLCTEIMEVSNADEYACCTLSSICLPEFAEKIKKSLIKPRLDHIIHEDDEYYYTFDYEKLLMITEMVTINLNKIIDINKYPLDKTEKSNKLHRPLGIGVQGLADTFLKLRLPYDSEKAREVNKHIFETMYYSAMRTSHQLACQDGPYPTFHGSPLSKGIFQFDMWKVSPSNRYDWEELRANVQKDGVRNSLLLAPMPTASTSQIQGNVESFEPYQSNIFKRQTLAGTFVVVNKYLIQDLLDLNLWSETLKNQIIANDGSVQNISEIPDNIKALYKTIWEMSNKVYIDMSADRGAFICQSQSLNLWMATPDTNKLYNMHMYAWKKGLKTGQYYLRSQPASDPQQFTIDPSLFDIKAKNTKVVCNEEVCTSCSA